jgi:hypothetical protein
MWKKEYRYTLHTIYKPWYKCKKHQRYIDIPEAADTEAEKKKWQSKERS